MRVTVITISDRAHRGVYEDLSGPEIERIISASFPQAEIQREIIPDDEGALRDAYCRYTDSDYILTTGGTGISPRDVTPEATEVFCDRSLPGIAEVLRAESYRETKNAMFSRGYAGLKGNTIIVNFPGSVKAVKTCTGLMVPIMEHGIKMMRGEGH